MDSHTKFLQAIQDKKYILMTKNTKDKGIIERRCVPYDYAVGKNHKSDNTPRYWTWHLETKHPSPTKERDVIEIKILDECFDPGEYVTWSSPYNWSTPRDWGVYS